MAYVGNPTPISCLVLYLQIPKSSGPYSTRRTTSRTLHSTPLSNTSFITVQMPHRAHKCNSSEPLAGLANAFLTCHVNVLLLLHSGSSGRILNPNKSRQDDHFSSSPLTIDLQYRFLPSPGARKQQRNCFFISLLDVNSL